MAIKANKVQKAKLDAIAKLKQKIEKGGDFIITEYRGLTVEQITQLRHQLLEKKTEYRVVKNNYARLAFGELGYTQSLNQKLTGPTAIAFVPDDASEVAKILINYAKEVPALRIKAGLIDKDLLDDKAILDFSKLPSRKVLLSMLLSAMQAPLQNFVFALNAIPSKLVRTIKAIEDQKAKV